MTKVCMSVMQPHLNDFNPIRIKEGIPRDNVAPNTLIFFVVDKERGGPSFLPLAYNI